MKALRFSSSAIFLILANLVPLYGALFAGWNVFSIMILFWLESAIIGFFTIRKMMRAEGTESMLGTTRIIINGKPLSEIQQQSQNPFSAKLFYIPFFSLHYGIFMFVHLIILVSFFAIVPAIQGERIRFDFWGVAIGFLSLLFSHTMSYKMNFISKGEYKVMNASQLFFSPYPRIIVMHLTLILGGIFAFQAGQSVVAIGIMVVLKIITDLGAHMFEHGQIAKRLL